MTDSQRETIVRDAALTTGRAEYVTEHYQSTAIPHHQLQPGDVLRWQCPNFPQNVHRWRVFGVYLGALGQEALIELESLTHTPGHARTRERQRVYVPEVLVRSLVIEDVGEQFGLASDRPETTPTVQIPTGQRLAFLYKNRRGETSHRTVYFHGLEWGATPWHPEPQWLLRALDIEKQEIRLFAMRDMQKVTHD